MARATKKNSAKKTAARKGARKGPKRDRATGQVSGGNPGNSGGKKGRSGRPRNEFRAACAAIVDAPEVLRAAKLKLAMPFEAGWGGTFRAIAAYGYGLPEQKLEITTDELRGRVVQTRDLLRRELAPEVFDRIQPKLKAIWDGDEQLPAPADDQEAA